MTLEERINDRIIAFYMRGRKEIAFELGVLYFELAKRRISRERVTAACNECIRWLRTAGCTVPDYLDKLSCWTQREELQKLSLCPTSR